MDGRDSRLAKWFTSARRFPQLIGRTPDGSQLPGGPYTITQLVVAGVTALVLWNTTWLWARFGMVGNLLVGPAILAGVVFAAGKLPFEMRSPIVIGAGWINALTGATSTPTPVRLRPPHHAGRGQVLMITDPITVGAVSARYEPAETAPTEPDPNPGEPGLPALTGVQTLLARR